MKSNLYNKEAIENLSTPEKMDEQVKMIPPATWLIFATVMIGVFATVLWCFVGTISNGADYAGVIFDNTNVLRVTAKESGLLQDVLVSEGDHVSAGDIIAVIQNEDTLNQIKTLREEQKKYQPKSEEYAKIENQMIDINNSRMLRSTTDGIVQRIELSGIHINEGETVATVVPESEYTYQEVYVYVSKEEAGAFSIGMEAQITPSYVTREEYGYMEGVISDISSNIVTENSILKHMGTEDYVKSLLTSKNCVQITVQLDVDANGKYAWSNRKGEKLSIHSGDQCSVRILKKEYHPYELIWDRFSE